MRIKIRVRREWGSEKDKYSVQEKGNAKGGDRGETEIG